MNNSYEKYINSAFKCVIELSKKYTIDESHSLRHSMEVMRFAEEIYESELKSHPYLSEQRNLIVLSAILHDMCDRKYVDEIKAISEIEKYMNGYVDFPILVQIITTMSYSKVKKYGYPELGNYNLAYHIVREADLLAAYDIDRCIMFAMFVNKMDYIDAVICANKIFSERVLCYISDGLFITNYSKKKSDELHILCLRNR